MGHEREEGESGPLVGQRLCHFEHLTGEVNKVQRINLRYLPDSSCSHTLINTSYVIKGLLKYHLTDSFQAQRHSLFRWLTKLALCVCVCIRLGTVFLSLSPLPLPPTSHTGNLTPLFCRSGPASHLSYLPLPKLRGPSPCTCKLHPALTCVAGLACTLVAVDFVDAPPVVAGFALTVVKVDLAVEAYRSDHMLAKRKVSTFE